MCRFAINIGSCSIVMAELWGLFIGLQKGWKIGFNSMTNLEMLMLLLFFLFFFFNQNNELNSMDQSQHVIQFLPDKNDYLKVC